MAEIANEVILIIGIVLVIVQESPIIRKYERVRDKDCMSSF